MAWWWRGAVCVCVCERVYVWGIMCWCVGGINLSGAHQWVHSMNCSDEAAGVAIAARAARKQRERGGICVYAHRWMQSRSWKWLAERSICVTDDASAQHPPIAFPWEQCHRPDPDTARLEPTLPALRLFFHPTNPSDWLMGLPRCPGSARALQLQLAGAIAVPRDHQERAPFHGALSLGALSSGALSSGAGGFCGGLGEPREGAPRLDETLLLLARPRGLRQRHDLRTGTYVP